MVAINVIVPLCCYWFFLFSLALSLPFTHFLALPSISIALFSQSHSHRLSVFYLFNLSLPLSLSLCPSSSLPSWPFCPCFAQEWCDSLHLLRRAGKNNIDKKTANIASNAEKHSQTKNNNHIKWGNESFGSAYAHVTRICFGTAHNKLQMNIFKGLDFCIFHNFVYSSSSSYLLFLVNAIEHI